MKRIYNKPFQKHTYIWPAIIALLFFLFIPNYEQVEAQSEDVLFVTFIDVGQGDSSLLRTTNGMSVLIDAGPTSAGQTILAYLIAQGITSLDAIILSHNHEDHIGGLLAILQSGIQAGEIYYNGNACFTAICQNVWAAMAARNIIPLAIHTDDFFVWDTLETTILNPGTSPSGNENEDSIVMNVRYYDHTILYTGDIGFSTETLLVDQGKLPTVDVLKVAHHGSASSSSSDFLAAIAPKNAVISVGANNSYGHPHTDTLNRLTASGADIYRTDMDGNIEFTFFAYPQEEPNLWLSYLPLIILDNSTPPPTPPPPPPTPMPGENIHCNKTGNVEICASVSKANPPKYSYVTVYGRLLINNVPQTGKTMFSTWHYKTTQSYCDDGVTGADGIAHCERYISNASAGYQVAIDVTIDGHTVRTWFTPTNTSNASQPVTESTQGAIYRINPLERLHYLPSLCLY